MLPAYRAGGICGKVRAGTMTYTQFKDTYSVRLNPQQEAAVRQVDGPVLLLAVPGSGKTTVLVTRLGYMIYCKNIRPENILIVMSPFIRILLTRSLALAPLFLMISQTAPPVIRWGRLQRKRRRGNINRKWNPSWPRTGFRWSRCPWQRGRSRGNRAPPYRRGC